MAVQTSHFTSEHLEIISKASLSSARSSLSDQSCSETSYAESLSTSISEREILSAPDLKAFSYNELRNATKGGFDSSAHSSPTAQSCSETSYAESLSTSISEREILSAPDLKAFSYNELRNATKGGFDSSACSSLTARSCSETSYAESLPILISECEILSTPGLKAFSFNELKNATRNFRPSALIGVGKSGHVYKGWIDEKTLAATKLGFGMAIAVKVLNCTGEGFLGDNEWLKEIIYLGQFHHPNLVKLIGYCLDGDNRILVYEFMCKRNLENHLFRGWTQPLPWAVRIKVAISVARGLCFLHDAESHVIYLDFRPYNILVDSDFNAKLSNWCLGKAGFTGDRFSVSTQVIDAYTAPEYIATGQATAKSDVYSFGVLLLELLSGRHALDTNRPREEVNLVEFAKSYLGNKRILFQIIDHRLEVHQERSTHGCYPRLTVPKHRG
ncbi:hypothetical protein L1049_024108 [Liquidambar formosana]|uniref:non-specific serine/threonine protein kinase n=1 Tax=Liquidambar formosana TaxID=63359 RepID=A0AAP0S077_LIQFO